MKNSMLYIKQLLCEDNSIYYETLKEDAYILEYDILTYRKHYNGFNDDVIQFIKDNIIDYSIYDIEVYYKNNLAAYIIDNLKSYNKISLKKAIKIAQLLKKEKSDALIICEVLNALFNKRYEFTTLRGDMQDDFIHCFYAVDIVGYNYLKYLEGVIFNTGIEIMIHEGDNIPTCADDIDGYTDYLPLSSYNLKKDIAEWLAVNENDIKLWTIKNTYTVLKVEYGEE